MSLIRCIGSKDPFPTDEIDHRSGANAGHNCDDVDVSSDQPARTLRLRLAV